MKRCNSLLMRLIATILVLVTLEALSFMGFHILDRIHPGSVVEISLAHHFREKVTQRDLDNFVTKRWDPELGWTEHASSERSEVNTVDVQWTASFDHRGARECPHHYDTLIAMTFGDSYTKGNEVNNNETWQCQASTLLNSAILNFGVGAYGTLQAVMRAERILRSGLVAPVTILGIFENNLERSVMAFRPIKYPDGSMSLAFMPTVRYLDGELTEFPNPWQNPNATLEELRKLAVAAADHDLWAQAEAYRMSFPYTLAMIRSVYNVLKFRSRSDDLWNSREGKEIMYALVERFVKTVWDNDSVPLILFIPGRKTLKRASTPPYVAVRDSLRKRYPEISILDVSEREFDRKQFNILPFKGHASPYGNRIIGDIVAEVLRDFESVPFESSP